MHQRQDHQLSAIILEAYDDDLAEAGLVVDSYAAQNILGDYQRSLSTNTRRRQKSELEKFCRYLARPTSHALLMHSLVAWTPGAAFQLASSKAT